MAIHVQCPGCGSQFAAPDQMAGQPARCNRCQSLVNVPHLPSPAAHNSRQRLLVMGLGLAAAGMVVGAAVVLGFLWINGRQRRFVPPGPAMAVQPPQPVFTPEPPPPWHPMPMQQQASWLVTPPALAVAPDNTLSTTRRDFPIAFDRLILPRDHTRFAVGVTPDANGRPQLHRIDLLTCQPADDSPSVFPYDGFDVALAEASPDGRFVACLQFGEKHPSINVYGTADVQQGFQSSVGESAGRNAALRFARNNLIVSVMTTDRDRLIFVLQPVPSAETPKRYIDPLIPASQVDLRTLVVSPGGQFAALVWPQDRSIRIWNLDAGQTAGVIQLKIACARTDLAWSPDGRRLALVDRGAAKLHLAVFDMTTGQPLFQTDHDQPSADAADRYEGRAIDWSSDGRQLLVGGTELFDSATGERVDSLRIIDPALAARQRRIIQPGVLLQCVAGTNSPWYVATQLDQWLASYQPPPMPEAPIAAAPPEPPAAAPPPAKNSLGSVASEPATPAAAQSDPAPSATVPRLKGRPATAVADSGAVWALPLDPPAALPAFKSGRISIKIDGIDALVFPPAPSRFCLIERSANGNRTRMMLDLGTGKPIGKEVVADEVRGSDVVASPDGRYFAGEIHPSRHVGVWSFATGQPTSGIAPPTRETFDQFTFVGSHRLVAFDTADSKTQATVWDVRDGKNHGRMVVDDESCSGDHLAITPSPGGKYVAALCKHRLKIVDPSALRIVAENSLDSLRTREFIRLFGAAIDLSYFKCYGIAWSPDATRLALALQSGNDGFLVCLDARTGATISQRILRHRGGDSDFGQLGHAANNRVDWTWDSGAILLGGTRLYDAPTGKDLFTLAFSAREGDQPRRIIRAWDVLTMARDADGDYLLSTFPLAKEALTKAVEQVRGAGEAVDALLPPLTVARYGGPENIMASPPAPWRSLVDSPPPPAAWPDAIELPEPSNDVRRIRFASPASGKLVLLATRSVSDGRSKSTTTTKIQQVDAVTRQTGPSIVIPNQYELSDFSPDGQLALLALNEEMKVRRLDVVGLNPKKHVAAWRPYSDEDPIASAGQGDKPTTIAWSAMVDAEHVFTLSQAGRLILWKLPECQAVYQLTGVEEYSSKDFSPNRKYLAFRAGGQMVVLESLTGTRFSLPASPSNVQTSRCTFRADGKEIWAWQGVWHQTSSIQRLDAATGAKLSEFRQAFQTFPSHGLGGNTLGAHGMELFRSDNMALLGGTALVDLSRNVLCWRYDTADRVRASDNSPDHRIWYSFDNPRGVEKLRLVAFDPYGDEVRARSANLQTDDQFWLRSGDKIRLAIDLGGARLGADAAKIEAAVRARLKAVQLVEDGGASITLRVSGFERDDTKVFTRSDGSQVTIPNTRVGVQVAILNPAGQEVLAWEFLNPPVVDISKPLAGQEELDMEAKKRRLLVDVLINQSVLEGIPGTLLKDPRDILAGETLLGPSGPEPMPEDRRLPPRPLKTLTP